MPNPRPQTEQRLQELQRIYLLLPASQQSQLYRAVQRAHAGHDLPRVWVFLCDQEPASRPMT